MKAPSLALAWQLLLLAAFATAQQDAVIYMPSTRLSGAPRLRGLLQLRNSDPGDFTSPPDAPSTSTSSTPSDSGTSMRNMDPGDSVEMTPSPAPSGGSSAPQTPPSGAAVRNSDPGDALSEPSATSASPNPSSSSSSSTPQSSPNMDPGDALTEPSATSGSPTPSSSSSTPQSPPNMDPGDALNEPSATSGSPTSSSSTSPTPSSSGLRNQDAGDRLGDSSPSSSLSEPALRNTDPGDLMGEPSATSTPSSSSSDYTGNNNKLRNQDKGDVVEATGTAQPTLRNADAGDYLVLADGEKIALQKEDETNKTKSWEAGLGAGFGITALLISLVAIAIAITHRRRYNRGEKLPSDLSGSLRVPLEGSVSSAPTSTRHDEHAIDILPPPPRGNVLDKFKRIMQPRAAKDKSVSMVSAYEEYEFKSGGSRANGAEAAGGTELSTSGSNPFHSDKI